ncbi:MAG: T9SS type A sorting domain-containing protein [Bacteroidota bacterium]
MKKFLLALLIAAPFVSMAQSLQLSNQKIVNESGLYKATVTIKNTSDSDKNVRVKRVIENLATGHVSYFCWGNCYEPEVNESPNFITIPAGGSDANSFYGDLEAYGAQGVSRVTYTFYDQKAPLDQVSYTVTYDISTGIASLQLSDNEVLSSVFPNPIQNIGKISYDLSGKKYSEANLIVRNLTGAIVKNVKLTNTKADNFEINTDQMGSGIYMYSLVIDGKAVLTRKMTVSK